MKFAFVMAAVNSPNNEVMGYEKPSNLMADREWMCSGFALCPDAKLADAR